MSAYRSRSALTSTALALAATLLFGAASALAASPPTVTIENAANVHFTTAEVEGSVDPGGEPTTYRFQYATQADFSDAVDGIRVENLEGTGPQSVGGELTNLQPNTTYHLRLIAENASSPPGEPAEAIAASTFTTKAVSAPTLTIASASTVTYHSAHVSGTVELANEDPAFNAPCAFQYITDEAFEQNIAGSVDGFTGASSQPCEPETVLASEAQPVAVKADLANLAPGTTYHLRLVASNLGGNATAVAANFATEAVNPPSATGPTVSAVTATSAHFEATVNAGGSGPGEQTAVYFFSCSPACPGLPGPEPIVADGSDHVVEATATGLEPNTPYTVTITATSPGGVATAEAPFTTQTLAPEVATLPFVGPASSQAARLYGTVNPHNSETTYFFEYGPTAAYGQSVPATKDAAVPPANSVQIVSQDLTGLSPTTTYHYRLVAKSTAGTTPGADQVLTTAASPPACSAAEQQLRAENNSLALPDCRAYEMATPSFKAGARQNPIAVSADGSRLIGNSIGVYGGSQGAYVIGFYESVRSSSGWETAAIDPPTPSFPAQIFAAASADLTRTLWKARHPSQSITAEDLYIREPGGSMVEVGPMLPPSATEGPPAGSSHLMPENPALTYKGASGDLSHVLFDINGSGSRWPGDTTHGGSGTGTESLYEYVGTGDTEPRLVGISDEGTPATIAQSHLISDCGTSLGSQQSQDIYNAVSADGEMTFFTAQACQGGPETGELYARLGGTKTVAISEPTHADCETCQTAAKAAAEFQGASEDGSKVFFLTAQELLPGDKGNNLYEYDFAGPTGARHPDGKIVPVSTSTGVDEPRVLGVARVSADGSHVYFVAEGDLTTEPNAEGISPTEGAPNLYLFERDAAHPDGRLAFLATLSPDDSTGSSGDWSARDNRPVQATPEGRFLLFRSVADLTPGDTSSVPQIFEYDAQQEELVRVSVGEAGYRAGAESTDARASILPIQFWVGESQSEPAIATTHLALSADGSTVLFESVAALVPGALTASEAGRSSVYEYRSSGPLSDGGVHLLSDGVNTTAAAFAFGLDAFGEHAFINTADPLIASDVNTQRDIYDAHAGGGFPAPVAASACAGENCQGPLSGAPPRAAPATPAFNGPGNIKEKQCKKGFVRKHGKCTKRHSRKHDRKHKRANTNRRVSR